MTNQIDWDFISKLEGAAVNVGYVPDVENSQSGVTIGTGFDLGSKNEEFANSIGLEQSLTEKLKPFFKLKGAEAAEVASNLVLSDSEVESLDKASKNYYANLLINKYEKDSGKSFNDLTSAQQTIIASVGFQYGNFDRTPKFWSAVVNGDWETVERELRNFGDNYSKRRNTEADLLGKKKVEALFVKDKKKEGAMYDPPINLWTQHDAGGELYLDRVFKTYQDWRDKREYKATLGEGVKAAGQEDMLTLSLLRGITKPNFPSDPNWNLNDPSVELALKENNILPQYYDEFVGTVSKDHFNFTIQRVLETQKNREILDSLGWKGFALEAGAFILDPISWLGYGVAFKVARGIQLSTKATRFQKFYKSGLIYGGTEATLFAPLAYENPYYGTSDLVIAAALGGTLGGGITAVFAGNLNKIAKAEMLMDINESGKKLTKKGEKEFSKSKKPFNEKLLEDTQDRIYDTSRVKDIKIAFQPVRNLPTLGLMPMNRSGALGKSKSELVRLFNFDSMEEPVGYVFKRGTKKGQIAAQPDTVELTRNQIIQAGNTAVYNDVKPALVGWLKENNFKVLADMANSTAVLRFDELVGKAVRSKIPSDNKWIRQAVQGYRRGYNFMAREIVRSRLDGWEKFLTSNGINALKLGEPIDEVIKKHLVEYAQYMPRRMSASSTSALQDAIGYEGLLQLTKEAILDGQGAAIGSLKSPAFTGGKTITIKTQRPLKENLKKLDKSIKEVRASIKELKGKKPKSTAVKSLAAWNIRLNKLTKKLEDFKNEALDLDESIKKGTLVDTKVAASKADILARAIIKASQMSANKSGFDIEGLFKSKNVDDLRSYLEEVLPSTNAAEVAARDALIKEVSQSWDLITSGRLEQRIRLNESYKTTINGRVTTFDELLVNGADGLWHSYMNEMSGLIALAGRSGIKTRTQRLKYISDLNKSIDEAYKDGSTFDKKVAIEEKDTIDSFFKNILGKSAENDPTDMFSTGLRMLRKYNFMRVLNQVGIAQLPEFGISVAQQGMGTLVQEIPHFRRLLVRARKGELDDTFFEELEILGSANGTEYLHRAITPYEIEDMGATAIGKAHDAGGGKILDLVSKGERTTGYLSGLFVIDSLQRRMTMRLFVNRFAKDLIDVTDGGKNLDKLGRRLRRYRVLGFTDDELKAIAKEFSGKNVITERTSTLFGKGRRVKHFNFQNWQDQDLVKTFARRVNRYTQRAVQYNYLGDTQRFFTDKALGKSMGQFRSFIMTAWSKQFLHNLLMADMAALNTALYTMFIGGLAYIGQTHMQTIGMSDGEKKKYLKKKFGTSEEKIQTLARAAFQRSGWSSIMPMYADFAMSGLFPEYKFNTRSSGLEINLWKGNPTMDLIDGSFRTLGQIQKSWRDDYRFSRTDLNRAMRLLPFQNMYGITNILNYIRDNSGLPSKGKTSKL